MKKYKFNRKKFFKFMFITLNLILMYSLLFYFVLNIDEYITVGQHLR
jgi:hypothetical protein